jgi:cation transport regulator ChaB
LVYGGVDELPEAVRSNYTDRCQSVFLRVFNQTLKNGESEERAFQNGHAAAKNCQTGRQ